MNGQRRTATIRGALQPRFEEILTPEALEFLAVLDGAFAGRRAELLQLRREKARAINAGANLDFSELTANIRDDASWKVAEPAPGLTNRRCELVSQVTRRMAVHALSSGANVWVADLEDSTAPTFANVIGGQVNLKDAVDGTLSYVDYEDRDVKPTGDRPTIVVRPRGWHLCEKHLSVDGRPLSAALVDFGLYFFHNAQKLIDQGFGPYFYLAKIESADEARLWNDVFNLAQDELGIPRGTIRATAHIETMTAAFQMDEILYELREHSAGLNAGRWDYIFSYVRTFAHRGVEFVLPDRERITASAPFVRACTDLMIATCHKRGAHAIGGPANVNPSRQDDTSRMRALAQVQTEKEREASEGYDGSWVAHPALVAICQEAYDAVLGDKPDQRDKIPTVTITAQDLVSLDGLVQTITLEGVRSNISVALQYLAAWVGGRGAVAIDNHVEDAATVEISRAQLWQWLFHKSQLAEGPEVNRQLLDRIVTEEVNKLTRSLPQTEKGAYEAARGVLEEVAFGSYLPGFFTPYAYVRYLTERPLQMSGALAPEDLRQSEKVSVPA